MMDLSPAKHSAAMERLLAPYLEYVTNVSSSGWAASLEVSALLYALADELQPAVMADYGSGFSSYVLRRWAADNPAVGSVVISLDASPEWLAVTGR